MKEWKKEKRPVKKHWLNHFQCQVWLRLCSVDSGVVNSSKFDSVENSSKLFLHPIQLT
jgi:hypothetical protein